MWVSTSKLAKIEGVTPQTIRRKIESGYYNKVKMTDGGHFRIFLKEDIVIGYARVSSKKQQTSLIKQEKILLKKYPNAKIYSDTASTFNFKRKGLKAILEQAVSGATIRLVATTQDRIARSGFELIRHII